MKMNCHLEPLDDYTNRQVCNYLNESGIGYETGRKMCADNREHNLISMPEDALATCVATQMNGDSNLKFNTFRDGKDGIESVNTFTMEGLQAQLSVSIPDKPLDLDLEALRRGILDLLAPKEEG